MARYIDADKLYVNVKAECNPYGKPAISFDDGCKVLDMIRCTPTADVAPVVHGVWLNYRGCVVQFDDDGCPLRECKCSICNDWLTASDEYACKGNYCPNCGAKMDG